MFDSLHQPATKINYHTANVWQSFQLLSQFKNRRGLAVLSLFKLWQQQKLDVW